MELHRLSLALSVIHFLFRTLCSAAYECGAVCGCAWTPRRLASVRLVAFCFPVPPAVFDSHPLAYWNAFKVSLSAGDCLLFVPADFYQIFYRNRFLHFPSALSERLHFPVSQKAQDSASHGDRFSAAPAFSLHLQ